MSHSTSTVLIISADPVPPMPVPISGAGLRAWSLGEGLRSRGFNIVYGVRENDDPPRLSLPDNIHFFRPEKLDAFINHHHPRVVLFQHWPLLLNVSLPAACPIAVDFHGPLIMEMAYQEREDYTFFLGQKVSALAKADFFTCAGFRQQQYFRAWLLASGIDVFDGKPHTIPISLSPQCPEMKKEEELTFVFGGLFLPWQDPSLVLSELVSKMEEYDRGRLLIFGGKHPGGEIPSGVYENLMKKLTGSRRVSFMGMISRDELLNYYLSSHIAVDLMVKNPERELAFTTRTVEYLWCGLAVIYNDYSDLSSFIKNYDAGWVLPHDDGDRMRSTFDTILQSPETVYPKIKAARKLALTEFNWEKTVEPLAQFCEQPHLLARLDDIISPSSDLKFISVREGTVSESYSSGIIEKLTGKIRDYECERQQLHRDLHKYYTLRKRVQKLPGYRYFKKLWKMLVDQDPGTS